MNFKVYKMYFPNGIHLGKKTIEDSEFTFCADTFFSALCQEAVKDSEERLLKLYESVQAGNLLFSDAFPYIGETYYIPKPMLKITKETDGNSKLKKAFKKLSYIPVDLLDEYLNGTMDVEQEQKRFANQLGNAYSKVSASIRGEEKTVPYRIGVYQFSEESGLYIVIGYNDIEDLEMVEELLTGLSYAGIGGKRSSGLGRFELYPGKMKSEFLQRLMTGGKRYMTLSVSLPQDHELEQAMQNARYLLNKRSGFIASDTYEKEYLRKKDLYVFQAGSCFEHRFEGMVYDVSNEGKHPVYRYAKPMFLEVSV